MRCSTFFSAQVLPFAILVVISFSTASLLSKSVAVRRSSGGSRGGGARRGRRFRKKPKFGDIDASDNETFAEEPDCFPSSGTVQTRTGRVRMHQLRVGSVVRSRNGWTHVFAFTHADATKTESRYLQVTAPPECITLSIGHVMRTGRGMLSARKLISGDIVFDANGEALQITDVRKVAARGAYNPQTLDGEIVVDNVLATTFTDAVHLSVATALLAPIRATYCAGVPEFLSAALATPGTLRASLLSVTHTLRVFSISSSATAV